MSTLDEITKEKQRVVEALARVDTQRESLTGQLGELEATERVLARYSKGTRARKTALAKTPTAATKAAGPAQSRGRRRTTTVKPAGGKRTSSSLGDQVLALATGKTQQEIAAACKGARPNHVGVVISRHKRAGRIEQRDGKLYATKSTETAQHATV
jgi:peptidoglycan hydrolase CwlO-like protein